MSQTQKTVTDFNPATTNGTYDELRESWLLNRDFAEMHLSTLADGTYLDEFGDKASEPAAQYAKRKTWSLALDPCQHLIGLRVDNIFRTPPKRIYDLSPHRGLIGQFLANVDGGQTSMDDFMRRVLVMYYTNGVDIVVDKAGAEVEPANQAQEARLGLTPYLHAFGPLERVDWAVDHAGKYLWARYCLGEVPPGDEWSGATGLTQYLTVTPDEWRLYEVPAESEQPATVTTGRHSLGICPVATFYFKESAKSDYPKVPLSLLTRIAPIARYLLNLISQIQLDIYRNIGFLVATGVDADQVPTEITPMGCWALPDGATLTDVAGPVEHIREKRELAQMLMDAILRIGKLAGHSGDLKSRATSGVQVAVERTDLDNEMQMTAAQAEAVEREIVRMAVSRALGRPVTTDELAYTVEYNKKYVLTGTAEIIANIAALVKTDTHRQVPEPLRILLRQLIGALAGEDDVAYATAIEQIAAMTAGKTVEGPRSKVQ